MLKDVEEIDCMFQRDVRVFSTRSDGAAWGALTPAERALVERAVAKRQNEFASGRTLARYALARLGVPAMEILRGSNGAPRWPAGVSGSISHCDTRAFVAAARRADIGTVGVDTEDLRDLNTELWPEVFTASELQQLRQHDAAGRNLAALILFSAKESLYKAQYPRTETFMEFSDVRAVLTTLDRSGAGTFSCVFEKPVGSFREGAVIPGRFRTLEQLGVVLTAVSISDQQVL